MAVYRTTNQEAQTAAGVRGSRYLPKTARCAPQALEAGAFWDHQPKALPPPHRLAIYHPDKNNYSNHQNCRHPSGRQLSQLPLSQKLESHQGFLRFWGFGS
jgi:hypothetical protein